MAVPATTTSPALEPSQVRLEDATRTQVRGSSLLLFGRSFALLVNLIAQVLVVRALSKGDYGALAYALSLAATASHVSLLGLGKAVSRFVPIFQERGDHRAMFGTIVTAFATVTGVGAGLVLLTVGLRGVLGRTLIGDPLAVVLLAIVIALAPLQALDHVFQSLLSVFARPRAIFFRRYVLKPLLKLLAILAVIAVGGSVHMLAVCYVVAGVIGVTLYAIVLRQVLKSEGLLAKFDPRRLRFARGRLFAFSLPLLSSELVLVLKTAMAVILLERLHGASEVATFRGVVPVAGLTLIVMQSFKFLYVPMASRYFARRQPQAIHGLFWQSAVWTSVMSFPIFAVCVFLAQPVTVLLFGERYADSAGVLAILAVGGYFNALFGLNSDTLEVYARVRAITVITVITGLVALILNLLLIPSWGAMGAAVATLGAVVTRNVANHVALSVHTDVRPFDRAYMRVYATIVLVSGGLLLLHTLDLGLAAGIAAVGAASLIVLYGNRDVLNIAQTFPALGRFPLLRTLVVARSNGPTNGEAK